MSSIPTPQDSSAPAVDWRELRACIERGMLRERGSLRGRVRRLEDASRNGKDLSAEIGRLLNDAQQSESQSRQRQAKLRSEEHTSELQSPDHLVCRLLLEKKKKKNRARTLHGMQNRQHKHRTT